jgi:diaminohydroxyphosphoribosylaminopyrimidine deaminase/5-amino-6-(5-phosphoribosylamino)uracil reductase
MDAHYLDQAMALAALGRGGVEPNPMVGCVIVRNGRVIGTGYHQRFGGAHAEPLALANCQEPTDGATVYVNLEPCCHIGKKTPPCVPQLIAARIGRVVIGCLDPNPAVAGTGAAQLRAAGIDVAVRIREAESKQLNAPFFATQREHRPYVTLKWAESADGKVAGAGGRRMQISGPEAQRASHLLRSRFDAILVGIGTALVDDPLLTTRRVGPHRSLARIVLDSSLRLSPASRLATTAREHATHVFSVEFNNNLPFEERATALRGAGIHIHRTTADASGKVDLAAVTKVLAEDLQVTHLMVEGGPTVQECFLRRNLADRAWVIRSPLTVGADDAPRAPTLPADFAETMKLAMGSDGLTEYLNAASPVYFETDASVDAQILGA